MSSIKECPFPQRVHKDKQTKHDRGHFQPPTKECKRGDKKIHNVIDDNKKSITILVVLQHNYVIVFP